MNRDKVICPCYQVTKGDIADAVEQGAKNFKEVRRNSPKQEKAAANARRK